MLSNSIGATPALALTWKPDPFVAKTAPRGEFTLKKSAGRTFGAANASGNECREYRRDEAASARATAARAVSGAAYGSSASCTRTPS